MNIGYLTCGRNADSDCAYTPFYAVDPIVKYIPKNYVIWLPFDETWSAFVQVFQANRYKVIKNRDGFFLRPSPPNHSIALFQPRRSP